MKFDLSILVALFAILSPLFPAAHGESSGTHSHAAEGADHDAAEELYTCPMHPDVKSNKPGNCPICHMKLVKIERPAPDTKVKDGSAAAGAGLSDVPLRNQIRLDATRFRLSGAKLTKVERRDLVLTLPVSGRAASSSRVVLQIPERDVGFLQPGVELELSSPAIHSEIIKGKLVALDSVLDPMTRTVRADVQLSRSYSQLRNESSVQGVALKKYSNVLAVPEGAIMTTGLLTYVFLADMERSVLIPKKVTLGKKGNDVVEISEGLSEGQIISAGPNFLLDSESRIQVSHGH